MSISPLPSPQELLTKAPLYEQFDASAEKVWAALDAIYFQGNYDNFCLSCGREATFQVTSQARPAMYQKPKPSLLRETNPKHPALPQGPQLLMGTCSRNERHIQHFVLLARSFFEEGDDKIRRIQTVLSKVGQFPSMGDLEGPELKRYAAVLGKGQLGELRRAVGLAAHGIGIGSFVYLRRILEVLVEEAHIAAKADNEWSEDAYSRERMAGRIRMLRDHLPTFLSENANVYSILSKGVHELSENDCLAHFSTLRISVELILDERLERKERDSKAKAAALALAKIVTHSGD